MKTFTVMLKDLRLICRDRIGLVGLLAVPIVVIMVVAVATQSGSGTKSILFAVVNEDQGPVANALIRSFRKHLDVRVVSARMQSSWWQAPIRRQQRSFYRPNSVSVTSR